MRRLQVDYQFLGRQIQMKNHQNLILVKMQLEKNNENDIERILDDKDGNGSVKIISDKEFMTEKVETPVDDSMQTRGITTYVKNGSAQKYGKEYSPKSGDKFVLSVTKGETVVLTKEITKSSKYKIESGVALEVGSITQGLASSMTAKYTKSTKYTGPTTKGTNTKLKEENILMQIKNIDFKNKSVINLKGETGLVVCLKKDNNIEKNVIKLRNVLIDLKNRKEVYGKVDLTYNDYILYSPYSN